MGGGIVILPLLTMIGFAIRDAQAVNLVGYLLVALLPLWIHSRGKKVEWAIFHKLILPALLGAICGGVLSFFVGVGVLKVVFGLFFILLGILQLAQLKSLKM